MEYADAKIMGRSSEFQEWLKKVETTLYNLNKKLFLEACAFRPSGGPGEDLVEIYGQKTLGLGPLIELRGDEPMSCFEMKETPEEYAKFLVEEWELEGPEGE